jgi:hypothetical protein
VTLTGIPFGTYSCVLAANQLNYFCPGPSAPREYITIQEVPAIFRVPDEGVGSLQIVIQNPDESEYVGPLVVTVLEGKPQGDRLTGFRSSGGKRFFAGPPFRVSLLNAGEYTIIPRFPACLEGLAVAQIEAGSLARCLLRRRL